MADTKRDGEDKFVSHITLTPAFKLVFLSVLGLTIMSLVGQFCIVAFLSNPSSDAAKTLMETCATVTKIGFGAIVGLLSGKSL